MPIRTLKFFDSSVVDNSKQAVGFTAAGLADLKSALEVPPAPLVLGKEHHLIPRTDITNVDITNDPHIDVTVPEGTVRIDLDIRLGLFSLATDELVEFRVLVDGTDIAGYGFRQQLQGHHNPHAFRILMDAADNGLTPGAHTITLTLPDGAQVGNVVNGEGIQDINIILEYLSA